MHFPKSTRLPHDQYSRRDLRFHVIFHAHPEISKWPAGVAELLWSAVMEQRTTIRVELFAACLMPDHLHLAVRPERQGLLAFVNSWKSWTTKLAWTLGHRGPLWQPGMWDRTIRDEQDFSTTVEYIIMNPVAAGLASSRDEWPWVWTWYGGETATPS